MKKAVTFAFVLVWALGTLGPAMAAPKASLSAQVLRAYILPSYERLAQKSEGMDGPLEVFCATPGALSRVAVDAAFKDLVLAWAGVEHIRFGPVETHNIHDRLFFWPDRKGIARRQVERAVKLGNMAILEPNGLVKKSAALQGLGALEHLLYGSAAAEILAGGPRGKYRCQFARAVAANITHLVRAEILAKWNDQDGHATLFLTPGPGNSTYRSQSEVELAIIKSYLNGLYYLRDSRLAGPLGLKRGARRKTRAAFGKSGNSMVAIRGGIIGLRDLFDDGGIAQWIGEMEPGIEKSVIAEFGLALRQAEGILVPLRRAVEDEELRSKLIAMGYPLKNARDLVHQVLTDHTDLPIGMNALDGD